MTWIASAALGALSYLLMLALTVWLLSVDWVIKLGAFCIAYVIYELLQWALRQLLAWKYAQTTPEQHVNFLMNLIARLRGHHNTDGVLASFRKHVTRLENVVAVHVNLADAKEQAAAEAKNIAAAARAEATKAAQAIGRLEKVFGVGGQ